MRHGRDQREPESETDGGDVADTLGEMGNDVVVSNVEDAGGVEASSLQDPVDDEAVRERPK